MPGLFTVVLSKRHLGETCKGLCSGPDAAMTENLTVPERTARVEVSDLQIRNLGRCLFPSPLAARLGREVFHPVGGADRVLLDDRYSRVAGTLPGEQPTFELAGPRDRLFFDPAKT